MQNINQPNDYEIDLFSVFKTLWVGKWKIIIITIITTLLGYVYVVSKPNIYEVITPIEKGKQSTFIKFKAVNDVLIESGLQLSDTNKIGYQINASYFFNMLVSEFNDYEEMIYFLNKNEFVKSSIKELDESKKRKELINYAKSFKINPPSKKNNKWTLYFEWRDVDEGSYIFNEALKLTLNNVKKNVLSDINILAMSVDMKNQRKIDELNIKLNLIEQNYELGISKKLLNLKEQSLLAKELGIENSQYKARETNEDSSLYPLYMKGYKAIDKEISNIKNRSKKEKFLFAPGFVELKEEILALKNDKSSTKLRSYKQIIETSDPITWVEFDLALADFKSLKKSLIYLALSIISGVFAGIIFVITSKILNNSSNFIRNNNLN